MTRFNVHGLIWFKHGLTFHVVDAWIWYGMAYIPYHTKSNDSAGYQWYGIQHGTRTKSSDHEFGGHGTDITRHGLTHAMTTSKD